MAIGESVMASLGRLGGWLGCTREIVERPKASFPLPFQEWVADGVDLCRRTGLVRELFSAPTLAMIAANPAGFWRLSWPIMNLALWGRAWWDSPSA